MQAFFETAFDVVYLSTVLFIGIQMIKGSNGKRQYLWHGVMALMLGFGDAFHLIPRVIALWTSGLVSYAAALGIGKLITSVTMTLFYVLLYYVWRQRYQINDRKEWTLAVWMLAIARILLCMMPQNEWLSITPPLSWGIYRNISFTLLGLIVIVVFYRSAKEKGDKAFRHLWLTIVLSFGFYIPVVLFADSFRR